MINDDLNNKKDNQSTSNKKAILLRALKKHKIGLLLVLLMLMLSTTLAWFVYNTVVDMSLQAHVKAWQIKINDKTTTRETAVFELDDLYPGMKSITFDDTVDISSIDCSTTKSCILVTNAGEMDADINLNVDSYYLFGELQENYTFSLDDKTGIYTLSGSDNDGNVYPFKLQFGIYGIDDKTKLKVNESAVVYFTFSWIYEKSEDDYNSYCMDNADSEFCTDTENGYQNYVDYWNNIDTIYGENSYDFNQTIDEDAEEAYKKKSFVITLGIDFSQDTTSNNG